MISHALLPFTIPVASFQPEVKSIRQEWQPHFNTMQYEGDWTVIALRSPGGSMDTIIPDDIVGSRYQNTPLMDQCIAIQGWIQQLRCEVMAVRLLQLQPGAHIKEHRDYELSYEQGEARLHIPVYTNPDVWFHIDNFPVQMKEGECWYMNANLPHRVVNNGNSTRIHLVIDCMVNEWLKNIFEQSEKTWAKNDFQAAQQENIIRELRLQQTPTALALADELEKQLNARTLNQ